MYVFGVVLNPSDMEIAHPKRTPKTHTEKRTWNTCTWDSSFINSLRTQRHLFHIVPEFPTSIGWLPPSGAFFIIAVLGLLVGFAVVLAIPVGVVGVGVCDTEGESMRHINITSSKSAVTKGSTMGGRERWNVRKNLWKRKLRYLGLLVP